MEYWRRYGLCIEAPWAIVLFDEPAPHATTIAHANKTMASLDLA